MNVLLLAAAMTVSFTSPTEDHHHSPVLGKLTFESSCSPASHAKLVEGLSWLHSFEYGPAARSFGEAATADPNCGMAHWGEAMSYFHPLWAPPTPVEISQAEQALAKARSAPPKTEREREYLAAIETFYRDSGVVDHKTRVLAYTSAMAGLHKHYPSDDEASVFYALSLVAAGTLQSDPNFSREKEAAAILTEVLKRQPDHPGVAHYLIHSFDYPPLAQFALPAAERYAGIAPASAHAQHMPSHIFTRLGLWDEAIKSNLRAEAAARAYAKAQSLPGSWDERLHAMDYLAYAYLQTGQDAEAQHVLDELNAIEKADPPNFKVAYTATAVPARILLERRRWKEAAALTLKDNVARLVPLEKFQWAGAHVHFARAVGAARSGDAAAAREETGKLKAIEETLVVPPGTYDWRKQVSIERLVADAWATYAEGKKDDALRMMQAAAELDDATEKHPVTPGAVLPAREQLGELLIELNQPSAALAEFEAALKRAPKRLNGLYGAAHAAQLAGDSTKAKSYFAELAEVTKASDGSRSEVKEARTATTQVAGR
jgi:tetratricopeptide (TPR) repeat protein